MPSQFKAFLHAITMIALAAVTVTGDQVAYAQSASCSQLNRTLSALNRNRDFRGLENRVREARQKAGEVQELESTFVRGGCQKQLKAGGRLDRQCRTVARRLIAARSDYNDLAARIETGQAVAQQREQTLQQIARFGCGQGSSARVVTRERDSRSSSFGNLFDRLFGNEGEIIDDGFGDYGFYGRSTYRSVCVRSCDGYYWPVSFATVEEYLGNDAIQCQSQCEGADVELYYYGNPGQSPDDMVNLAGQPYSASPNAFRYRREYDASCTCKTKIEYGAIVLANSESDGGESRAFIEFNDLRFPLPMRDPRASTTPTTVAEVIRVPLPRKRPLREGETAPAQFDATPVVQADTRTIKFGDRTVRIVGPDTPYSQLEAAGS